MATSGDRTIKLWDAVTFQLQATFICTNYVSSICLNATNTKLANISYCMAKNMAQLHVWDLSYKQHALAVYGESRFNAVAFSSTGAKLVYTSCQSIFIREAEDGQLLQMITSKDYLFQVCCTSDESKIITGNITKLQVWDTMTGEESISIEGLFGARLICCHEGTKCIEYGHNKIRISDFTTGEIIRVLESKDPHRSVLGCCFGSSGSNQLFAVTSNNALICWDIETGDKRFQIGLAGLLAPNEDNSFIIAFNYANNCVMVSNCVYSICYFDAASGELRGTLEITQLHDSDVGCIHCSPLQCILL
jgi:WD40 repeat protein